MNNNLFTKTNKFLRGYEENFKIELSKLYQINYDEGYSDIDNEDKVDAYLWNNENEYYPLGAKNYYDEIIEKELKELNDKGVYFPYCKFKTYEKTYQERLNGFLNNNEDAEPINFLQNELKTYLKPLDFFFHFKKLKPKKIEKLSYTRNKTVEFITEHAKKIGYKITIELNEFEGSLQSHIKKIEKKNDIQKQEVKETEKLKWSGTDLELSEILKSLLELKKINGHSDKQIFETIFKMFGMKYSDSIKKERLATIKKRIITKTPFLNQLSASLELWIDHKDD